MVKNFMGGVIYVYKYYHRTRNGFATYTSR